MKIYALKNGSLNEADRLELSRLLIKAGYTVRIGKEKAAGKNTNVIFVEFKEEKDYA